MAEAFAYLVCATFGAVVLRFAEAIVAAQRRLNEAIAHRLPRPMGTLLKPPDAAYGAMHLFYAFGGMMLVGVGLIGFFLSL